MRQILFFILFTNSYFINAQELDLKLVTAYDQAKKPQIIDSNRVDSLFKLVYVVHLQNKKVGDSLNKDFFILASKKSNNYLKAKAYLINAIVSDEKGNTVECISNLMPAIRLLNTNVPRKDLCFAYQLLAALYGQTGNHELSNQATIKALRLAKQLNNNVLLGNSYNFLGVEYNKEKKHEKAKLIFLKLMAIMKQANNNDGLMKAYGNLGTSSRDLGELDSALYYSQLSLQLAKQLKNRYSIAYAYNDIGSVYLKMNQYYKAIAYLKIAANMREIDEESWQLGYTYGFLSDCYVALHKKDSAIFFCYKKIALSIKSGDINQHYEGFEKLSNLYANYKQFDSAYFYNHKFETLKDSVIRIGNKLATEVLMASYQSEEKEKEITLLNETAKTHLLKIQKQQLLMACISGGVLLLLIIIVLFIRTKKQRTDQLLLQAQLKEESLKRIASQNLQKEKERISRDLHDNVGGQLSYVLYSLDGINNENKDKRTEVTQSVNQSVRNVISNLRETIWAINDEVIFINDFSDKLKVYARAMFRNTETKISFVENNPLNIQLNSLVGLNLYRICQEVINNAFKYANAQELEIKITTDTKTTIIISDNGIGFDIASITSDGFGLSNIKARATEAGINLTIEAKLNQGVKYTMVV